ncbi:hypothetical protein [Salinigranum sp. GCM10025319]|uniref:hypothetical protein n=1 Tax=Salinigranum sp. GCM10025319 TaxID=3252687 RepID=UPI00361BC89E
MRQPSRRTFLRATAGTGLGFVGAGCLGRDGPQATDDSSATPTDPSATTSASTSPNAPPVADLGTERTVGGTPVTVSSLSVQDSVLTLDDDAMTLVTHEEGRYVLVSVIGSDSGPAPESFSLVVDDDRYPGRVDVFGGSVSLHDRGPKYDPSYGTDGGWIAFVVPPALDAREARIRVENGADVAEWRLDAEHLDALRRSLARFELRRVDLPERLRPYEPVSVRVAAENVSDVPGVFRGVLNVANLVAAYAPYPFALDADPGETVVWEQTFTEGPSPSAPSVGFFLDTVAGERDVRATVGTATETGSGSEVEMETETGSGSEVEMETETGSGSEVEMETETGSGSEIEMETETEAAFDP